MTKKEELYNSIADILRKGWKDEPLAENMALLDAFISKLTEEQAVNIAEVAEQRFKGVRSLPASKDYAEERKKRKGEKKDTFSYTVKQPLDIMAFGLAVYFANITASKAENKETWDAAAYDMVADTIIALMPGQGIGAEWPFIGLLETMIKGAEETEEEILRTFKSVAPDNYLLPTGKVIRAMTEREKGAAVVIPKKGKAPAVKTQFVLTFTDDIKTSKTVSKTEMFILNGVISLLKCGNVAITPAMAYRAAAGWEPGHEVKKSQEETAEKSIERLRRIFAEIDATGEVQAYCKTNGVKDDVSSFKLNGPLLACEAADAIINGKKAKGYLFNNYDEKGKLKPQIIERYASISGQISSMPMEFAALPVSATEGNIILRNYLWVQIEAMKNPKAKRRPEVSYEGIYKELGIKTDNINGRKQAQRAREATDKLLDNWRRKGAIKGYSTYSKNNKVTGVVINP